jgi:hypothetical protein
MKKKPYLKQAASPATMSAPPAKPEPESQQQHPHAHRTALQQIAAQHHKLVPVQDNDDATEADVDAELAAAKAAVAQAATSGRLLCRSFGFRNQQGAAAAAAVAAAGEPAVEQDAAPHGGEAGGKQAPSTQAPH